jgi:cell division protein FtsW (lipid II flippase)
VTIATAVLTTQALTFTDPGLDGVHRWLSVGGLRLHVAALTDPILLVALPRIGPRWAPAFAVFAFFLHLVQPDAAQATALAAGMLAAARFNRLSKGAPLVAIAGAALTWWPALPASARSYWCRSRRSSGLAALKRSHTFARSSCSHVGNRQASQTATWSRSSAVNASTTRQRWSRCWTRRAGSNEG